MLLRVQKFAQDDVRAVMQPGKTLVFSPTTRHQQGVSPSKTADFLAQINDAIANGYDPKNWPPGIAIWQLHQCTKKAEDLNTSLYGVVLASITDSKLKDQVAAGLDGDLVSLLLSIRRRVGSNAGVQHIKNAVEHGTQSPAPSS